MALKDAEIRALKGRETSYKVADGKGLYVEVFPNGSKLWRQKYRIGGKEKRLALGAYPEVTLAEARKRSDAARAKIEQGIDPGLERKREKATAKISAENSFERVAEEYLDKMAAENCATPNGASWTLPKRFGISRLAK